MKSVIPRPTRSPSRVRRSAVLDKAKLILRNDNLPMLLRPIQVRNSTVCQLTKKRLEPGDYAYPCMVNPIRLNPYGDHRAEVNAAISEGESILPKDWFFFPIPTLDTLVDLSKWKKMEAEKIKALTREGTKLLKAGGYLASGAKEKE